MDQKWWWPKSHTSKCKSSTMVNLKLAKLQNLNLMFTKIEYAIKRKHFVILEKLTRISANFKLIYKADVMLLTSHNEIEGVSYILRSRISKQRFWNLFHKMIDTVHVCGDYIHVQTFYLKLECFKWHFILTTEGLTLMFKHQNSISALLGL